MATVETWLTPSRRKRLILALESDLATVSRRIAWLHDRPKFGIAISQEDLDAALAEARRLRSELNALKAPKKATA